MKLHIVVLLLITSLLSAQAAWPPAAIHEVRAYVYDYTQEKGNVSLLKGGKIHSGLINTGGAKLSDKQVAELIKALNSPIGGIPKARCYMPHHGFVFLSQEGKAIGHIELCFQCGRFRSTPEGGPTDKVDWKSIQKLLGDLKIPILAKSLDYTDLFQKNNPKREQADGGNQIQR